MCARGPTPVRIAATIAHNVPDIRSLMASSFHIDPLTDLTDLAAASKIWLGVELGACVLAGCALTGLAVVIAGLVFSGLGVPG